MTHTIRFDTTSFASGTVYGSSSFATDRADVACYTTGITISGPLRSTIFTQFPDSAESPYRKLIDGGA